MDNIFDFVDSVLENCAFDLTYHEKIKPLATEEQEVYFRQSVDRIESARRMLHMIYLKSLKEQERESIPEKKTFFSRIVSLIWKNNDRAKTTSQDTEGRT